MSRIDGARLSLWCLESGRPSAFQNLQKALILMLAGYPWPTFEASSLSSIQDLRTCIISVEFLNTQLFFVYLFQFFKIYVFQCIKAQMHVFKNLVTSIYHLNCLSKSNNKRGTFFLRFLFIFFDVDRFLKSLLNLLQYCFCLMFWFFGHEACGILAPWPGIEPTPPALEGEVLTTGPPGES